MIVDYTLSTDQYHSEVWLRPTLLNFLESAMLSLVTLMKSLQSFTAVSQYNISYSWWAVCGHFLDSPNL